MRAFGLWLDYVEWKALVQRGEDDPPPGDGISDMARSVILLEEDWKNLMEQYISSSDEDRQVDA